MSSIGKLVDRADKLVDLAINAGVGYYGYRVNNHWTGALTGLLGLKLAKSDNLISGGAGITILTALGLLQLTKPFWASQQAPPPTYPITYHGQASEPTRISSGLYASK